MLKRLCKNLVRLVLLTIGHWNKKADREKHSNKTDFEDSQDDDLSYIESILAYAFVNIDNLNLGKNKPLFNPEVVDDIEKVAKSAFFYELKYSSENTRQHSSICAIRYIINSAKSNTWGFDPKDKVHKAKFDKITEELLIFSKQNYKKRTIILARI